MYLSYDATNWRPKGKGTARRVLADINPNSYLQTSSRTAPEVPSKAPDALHPSITSSCIVGFASSPSIPSIGSGPTPQPRINTLPTELLTTIFLLCLPSRSPRTPNSTTAPLLLSHVCSYWRRLAQATPFLWQDLDLGEVRPGIVKRRVMVCYDDEVGKDVLNTTLPHHHTPHPRTLPRSSRLCLHTLALPSIATHFSTLAHPLPLRVLKIDVSRYRWDVKTDWERTTRSWVVERLVPVDPEGHPSTSAGETRRASIHRYQSKAKNGTGDEEYYYYELISARDVLESVLFAEEGFSASRVGALDISMDDLDDLPAVQIQVSPAPTPVHVFGAYVSTSSPPSLDLAPSRVLSSLHTLSLSFPNLLLSELFDATLVPGGPTVLFRRLPVVAASIRKKLGYVCGYSPGSSVDAGEEGYTSAFCHDSTVPNLRNVQMDVPWVALVPGRYTSPSNDRARRPRFHPLRHYLDEWRTGPRVSFDSALFDQISLVPYAQLTNLTIVDSRPVPVWLLRALLVECVALKVGRMSVVGFIPPRMAGLGGVGGVNVPGGGVANANGSGNGAQEDLGLNLECYGAFGGDPVVRALSRRNESTRRDPSTSPGADMHGERLWDLPTLEELVLRFGCTPRKEDAIWVRRQRDAERERWGIQAPLGGGLPVPQGALSVFLGQGMSGGAGSVGEGDAVRKWRDVVAVDGGRVLDVGEESVLEFALSEFSFGDAKAVVRVGFA